MCVGGGGEGVGLGLEGEEDRLTMVLPYRPIAYFDAMCSWQARIERGNWPALMALLNLNCCISGSRLASNACTPSWLYSN